VPAWAPACVYIATRDTFGQLFALRPFASSNAAVWSQILGGPINSSPVVSPDGTNVLFGYDDHYVYCFSQPLTCIQTIYLLAQQHACCRADNGTQLWCFNADGALAISIFVGIHLQTAQLTARQALRTPVKVNRKDTPVCVQAARLYVENREEYNPGSTTSASEPWLKPPGLQNSSHRGAGSIRAALPCDMR
jgi:hypothetical protein